MNTYMTSACRVTVICNNNRRRANDILNRYCRTIFSLTARLNYYRATNQMTAFVALMTMDARRQEAGRTDIFCCFKTAQKHKGGRKVRVVRRDGWRSSDLAQATKTSLGTGGLVVHAKGPSCVFATFSIIDWWSVDLFSTVCF